jgi:hypothetical protein
MKPNAEPEMLLELKYCESCGGLQLRPVGSGLLYCARCEVRLAGERMPALPPSPRRRRNARLPSGSIAELHGCAEVNVAHAYMVELQASEVRA